MYETFKKRHLRNGRYMGEVLKNQSDLIMDKTFTNDIAYRQCYIDGEPVDAKYIVYTYYSISKDAVDYHLQFRPGVHYPIGKYIDVPDDTGKYNRWLIVGRSDEPQFVKYNILKCNWTFKWMINGTIHECLGVLRKRNNYNAGLWINYLVQVPENQTLFIVPTNPITQTINYNMRFLISDNKTNPLAWEVAKREDMYPVGITSITLKQSLYDPKKDNAEQMIADYYQLNIEPENPKPPKQYKITHSSTPTVKVGGSYKIFNINPLTIDEPVSWKVKDFDSENYSIIFDEVNPNKFKIKVAKNYNLIGTIFTLELYVDNTLADSIPVEVVGI